MYRCVCVYVCMCVCVYVCVFTNTPNADITDIKCVKGQSLLPDHFSVIQILSFIHDI